MHILFVCTGNICRSPTAERLAAAYAVEMGITNFTATSAGTRAVVGHPIHSRAAVVLEQLGGDPTGFAARHLSPKVSSEADLIVTMTTGHRDQVLELSPQKLTRTFTLSEVSKLASDFDAQSIEEFARLRPLLTANDRFDIPDPIGQNTAVFEAVGSQIAELVRPVVALCS